MYELIVVGTVDGAAALFDRVEKFLKEANAQNVKSEKMGKKLLAYKIAKQTEGEYFLFNFDADPSEILGLDRKIRLEQEAVLRHLLIKTKTIKVSKARKVLKAEVKPVVKEPEAEKTGVKIKPKVTVTTKVTSAIKQSKSKVKVESKVSKAKGKK